VRLGIKNEKTASAVFFVFGGFKKDTPYFLAVFKRML